jgi:hypothetical protein
MSYPPHQPEPPGHGELYGQGQYPGGQHQPGRYPAGQDPAGPGPASPFPGGPPHQPGAVPPGQYQPGGQYPPGAQYQPGGQQPPGGQYPQAGPYQPAGYPPPAAYQPGRPGRPGLLVSAVLLGILAVAALGIALALGHAATACSSDIGQLAQAFDQQAAGDCSAASTARTVLEIAAPVLALGCVAVIIAYRRRR